MSGEPEARIVMWWCREHGAQMQMVDGEPRPDCAEGCGPMLAVPYVREVAVADAVRAERERVTEALREHTVDRADEDGCLVPMNPFTSWREAADFIERLPPADGNTEEGR